jgi:hypothetical protein
MAARQCQVCVLQLRQQAAHVWRVEPPGRDETCHGADQRIDGRDDREANTGRGCLPARSDADRVNMCVPRPSVSSGIVCALGTATPSIESIMNALEAPGFSALPARPVARARTVLVPCAATADGPL